MQRFKVDLLNGIDLKTAVFAHRLRPSRESNLNASLLAGFFSVPTVVEPLKTKQASVQREDTAKLYHHVVTAARIIEGDQAAVDE